MVAGLDVDVDVGEGMPLDVASSWLAANGLDAHVAPSERARLDGAPIGPGPVRPQAEALWDLAWGRGPTRPWASVRPSDRGRPGG